MPTTFTVFSLGRLPVIDPVEGNNVAGNADALVGLSFGAQGNPLFESAVTFSPGTRGFSRGQADGYDQDNDPSENFRIEGGSNQTFDAISIYNATLTYTDGSTATITAVVFQDTDGNTYLAPEFTQNPDQDALEAGPIRTLTLDSLASNTSAGLGGDRESFDFVTCYTPGAMILTGSGEVPVETLAVGDPVFTRDHGLQPIRWIGRARRAARDALVPVRIARGALGNGCPNRDLIVSQQHRMLLCSRIAERMTGTAEILVPAKKLLGLPGVTLATDYDEVDYIHLLLDRHEIIFAEGTPTETLLTGPMARDTMSAECRVEIDSLFPGLLTAAGAPARPIPKGRIVRQLIARHLKNDKPVLQI